MKKLKKIPRFKSEEAERRFWAHHSPLEYIDARKASLALFPNLKPTNRMISIRLPESLVIAIQLIANKQDIPYQSMLKILLAEKVRETLNLKNRKSA